MGPEPAGQAYRRVIARHDLPAEILDPLTHLLREHEFGRCLQPTWRRRRKGADKQIDCGLCKWCRAERALRRAVE